MKSLLAILLSFLLAEAPAFAIHGGYTLGGSGNLAGTYAGVLIPVSEQAKNGFTNTFGNNDLGLFLMNVPSQGLATGSVAIFSGGVTFEGTLMALPDPTNANGLRGVINATYNNNHTIGVVINGNGSSSGITSSDVIATAAGQFSAAVGTQQGAASSTSDGQVLTGSATLEVAQNVNQNGGFFFFGTSGTGGPIVSEVATFAVDGIQQSTNFTQSTATLNNATTSGH